MSSIACRDGGVKRASVADPKDLAKTVRANLHELDQKMPTYSLEEMSRHHGELMKNILGVTCRPNAGLLRDALALVCGHQPAKRI